MKGTVELNTERLVLRKMQESDYEDIFKCWTSDYEVSKYVTWKPHENSEQTKKLVSYWLNDYNNEYTYRWIITLKDTSEVIGMIDVIAKNIQYMTAEVGYCLGSKYWGKGYATEALKEVIKYLHSEGFPTVYAQHFISNIASGKVMKKAGMEYEATLKSRVVNNDGNREDVCVYSSVSE